MALLAHRDARGARSSPEQYHAQYREGAGRPVIEGPSSRGEEGRPSAEEPEGPRNVRRPDGGAERPPSRRRRPSKGRVEGEVPTAPDEGREGPPSRAASPLSTQGEGQLAPPRGPARSPDPGDDPLRSAEGKRAAGRIGFSPRRARTTPGRPHRSAGLRGRCATFARDAPRPSGGVPRPGDAGAADLRRAESTTRTAPALRPTPRGGDGVIAPHGLWPRATLARPPTSARTLPIPDRGGPSAGLRPPSRASSRRGEYGAGEVIVLGTNGQPTRPDESPRIEAPPREAPAPWVPSGDSRRG